MLIDKDRLYISIFLIVFWIRGVFGFVCEEIIPSLQSMMFTVYFLFDVVIVILGLYSMRTFSDRIFFGTFLVVGYWITCIYNEYSVVFFVNGLRDFLYMLFLIPIFRFIYSDNRRYNVFREKFDKTLYYFLVIQVFCVGFQFLKYGANDHGGGSLGNWNSGIITTMIYVISFYLMKQKMNPERYFQSLCEHKGLIILLFPTFLNETKISFIYLFLYFVLLLPINKKLLVRLVVMIPVMMLLLYGAMAAYVSATGTKEDITSGEYYTETYLFSENVDDAVNWAEYLYETEMDVFDDIPRFTKYMLIPEIHENYPGHIITGYGIGQFKGGTTIKTSKFYKDNEWLFRGTVPYGFHIFIQLGLFSFIFFVWFWKNAISFGKSRVKAEKGIVIYVFAIVLLVMFYNDSLRSTIMCIPMFYVLFQSLTGNINKVSLKEE